MLIPSARCSIFIIPVVSRQHIPLWSSLDPAGDHRRYCVVGEGGALSRRSQDNTCDKITSVRVYRRVFIRAQDRINRRRKRNNFYSQPYSPLRTINKIIWLCDQHKKWKKKNDINIRIVMIYRSLSTGHGQRIEGKFVVLPWYHEFPPRPVESILRDTLGKPNQF